MAKLNSMARLDAGGVDKYLLQSFQIAMWSCYCPCFLYLVSGDTPQVVTDYNIIGLLLADGDQTEELEEEPQSLSMSLL